MSTPPGWQRPPTPVQPPEPARSTPSPPRRPAGRGWTVVVTALLVIALAFLAVTVAQGFVLPAADRWQAQRDGYPDDPLVLTEQLMRDVRDRDGEAIAAVLHEEQSVVAPNENHARQPRPEDLLVGDEAAGGAIDLAIRWTTPRLDPREDDPLTSVSAKVVTDLTYEFTVDGTRYESSHPVHFAWFRADSSPTGRWGLKYVVTPDADEFETTFAPAAVRGVVTEPGAAAFGVGVCASSWIAVTQALDVHDSGDQAFACWPDGVVPDAVDPAVRAQLALPPAERSFDFEVLQEELTLIDWSDARALSQWLIELDGREYVVVVAGTADGTGRVVAAVPAG